MPKNRRFNFQMTRDLADAIELPDNSVCDDHFDSTQARKKMKTCILETTINPIAHGSAALLASCNERCKNHTYMDENRTREEDIIPPLVDQDMLENLIFKKYVPKFSSLLLEPLISIYNTLHHLTVTKRGFSYSKEEKLNAVKLVVLLLTTWRKYVDYVVECDSNNVILDQNIVTDISHSNIIYIPSDDANFTVAHAVDVVNVWTGIGEQPLRKWLTLVYQNKYDDLNDSMYNKKKRKIVTIESESDINIVIIGEVISKIYAEKAKGKNITYRILKAHLSSSIEPRLFDSGDLPNQPIDITNKMIRTIVIRHGILKWGETIRKGKIGLTGEEVVQRYWVMRIQIAQYCFMMQRQACGLSIAVFMDESYCHQGYQSKFSLCLVDDNGKALSEVERAKRDGLMVIIVGALCKFGPVTCHDSKGNLIKPFGFINKNFEQVAHHGKFVEYGSDGQVRSCYKLNPILKKVTMSLSKPNLILECKARLIPEDGAKQVLVDRINKYEVDHAPVNTFNDTATEDTVRPEDQGDAYGVSESILTDWSKIDAKFNDLAPATDILFIANKADGDYHANMNTYNFFKWIKALSLTWLPFLKELQIKKDNGLLPNETHDFYDFENNMPLRIMDLMLDGAPYHMALPIQIGSLNKVKIAKLLREVGVVEIKVGDRVVKVPPVEIEFKHSNSKTHPEYAISKTDLVVAASKALTLAKPDINDPPWVSILKKAAFQFRYEFSMPYLSSWLAIELKWADIKNYVGHEDQYSNNRSLAELCDQIYDRINSNHTKADSLLRSCEKNMNKWINTIDIHHNGPFSGEISSEGLLDGLCSYKDWESHIKKEWYEKANVDVTSYKFTSSGSFGINTQQAVDLAERNDEDIDDDDTIL
jgi:hypothetical protein